MKALVALALLASVARADDLDAIYPALDALYQDLHRHPELSNHEEKTAARLAAKLRAAGYEVTERFGGNGIVGVMRNGAGPTLLVRTDMDALPVKEDTGLPYASTVDGVMHACGHDIHMTSWVGAAQLLARARGRWHGTLVFVGQPAEEIGGGAHGLVGAGLFERFPKPDFVLGLHDSQRLAAGEIGVVIGPAMSASSAVDITVHGRGGHGAYPHLTVDPIVIAARIVGTLQTVVAREVSPLEHAVITVGTFHAGTKRNIIPDDAKLELTVRSFKPEVQQQLLAAIERIAKAEAAAGRAPREPDVVVSAADTTEVVVNDPALARRLVGALRTRLGAASVHEGFEPALGSEDFGVYGHVAGVPAVFLFIGASEPGALARAKAAGTLPPGPHSSKFAPDREPTLRTGVTAFTVSALELLQ